MLIVSPDYTLSHFRRLAPFSDRAFNERFADLCVLLVYPANACKRPIDILSINNLVVMRHFGVAPSARCRTVTHAWPRAAPLLKTSRAQLAANYLTTFGAFSVGAIEKANQVFQPDDRF